MKNLLFVPNLGSKRRIPQPAWGADFFADAFKEHSEHDVSVEYTLDNVGDYDAVWIHNIANMLKGVGGRLRLVKMLLGKHPTLIGGVRGEVCYGASKLYLPYFDAIHTSNYKLSRRVRAINRETYTIVSGVNLDVFKPAPSPEGWCIGWAGDAGKKMKNIDIVYALLEPTIYATKSNYIPHHEMPAKFYHRINALVHPSSHEGSCRVITEAAACGLPIICTDVGHNKLIVNHNHLFHLRNAVPQIKKIIGRLKSPGVAEDVGKGNRARVTQFAWNRVIARCDDVIRTAS